MNRMTSLPDLREDFPILRRRIRDMPLCYLDNAATTQKPQQVIDSYTYYYQQLNANIHRGVHLLSEEATQAYEAVRQQVRTFLNAAHAHECIFTKSTTEAINLIAHSFGQAYVRAGDEILISALEHHSNIVPWQMLCQRTGATLKIIPQLPSGDLDLRQLDALLSPRTKLLAITHISNALGTVNDIKAIIDQAHAAGVPVLVDGAQSVAHAAVDVQALDCDFFTFSGHKIYGPTGVGVLYGKTQFLEAMPPFLGGGDMVLTVTFKETRYNALPHKFEAGTPPIAEVVALGAALRYFQQFSLAQIEEHEAALLTAALTRLKARPGICLVGEPSKRASAISFTIKGVHPHDVGSLMDQKGVAIRSGHHCAMPIMEYYGLPATSRISFGLYNRLSELDQLDQGLDHIYRTFRLG